MVRVLDIDTQAALRDRRGLVVRNFIVVTAKDRETGEPVVRGFWDDVETVVLNVVSGETGAEVSRTFVGDGAVVSIDPIPMRIGLEVRTIQIVLSQVHDAVEQLIRGDDPRGAKVEIYRGFYDLGTQLLVAPPRIRFLGKVNEAPIETPAAGGEGSAVLRVVSHTRELTRTNPAKKSDEEQRKRSGDRFRRYTGVVKEWPIFWGEERS